jgi:prepilin-type N-terminal cleavage/methylation domain-containing protein
MKFILENRQSCQNGFTLLELLVVMILLGLMVGLSVPRLLATVETVSADAEKRTLSEMLDQVKLYSFLRHQEHTFLFEGRTVVDAQDSQVVSFEYIRFPKQQIRWNPNGFPDAGDLEYTIRDRKQSFALY